MGDDARRWVIRLPWDTPPIKPNGGYENRYVHARKVKAVRADAGKLVRSSGVPRGLRKIRVQLVWIVPDRRRRDTDNLWMLLKACADSMTAGGRSSSPWDWPVVEDDTPEFMSKPEPQIVYRKGEPKRLLLVIHEVM